VLRNVNKFFTPLPQDIPDSIFDSLNSVYDYLERVCKLTSESLTPLTIRSAIKLLPNDTSPGLPYTLEGIKTKGEVKERLFRDYNTLRKIPPGGFYDYPCSAGIRLALTKKPDNKPRLVWVYPAVMITAESRFFGPLMSKIFSCLLFSWDFSFLRGGVNSLKQFCQGLTTYGTDVSGFDASVHPMVINHVFDWICSRFKLSKHDQHDFDVMRHYFINTPLWYKNRIYLKRQGVPSGSFFTQTIDSIVNVAYQLELIKSFKRFSVSRMTLEKEFKFLRVLGDDSLVALYYEVTLEQFTQAARDLEHHYSVVINVEKGFFRSPESPYARTNFLGFDVSLAAPPYLVKPATLIVAQCIFPEVAEKDAAISMARLIGIKWSSGDDPFLLSIVNEFYDLLELRYPGLQPSDLPKEYQLMFRYVFGRYVPDITKYPSDAQVISRYRDFSDPDVQLAYVCPTYWDYVLRRYKPADYITSKLVSNSLA